MFRMPAADESRDALLPVPMPEPVPASDASPAASAGPRRWTSAALLGDGREALIEHLGAVYRLRLTLSGKLILTK